MSYTAPTLSISVASQRQIQEGIDLLTALLGVEVVDVAPAAADTPNDEAELSPQQKAARTRAKNKAVREAAAAVAREAKPVIPQPEEPTPATPPTPTTPPAPASVVPTAPAPAASNLVDYSTLSAEASAKHQQLSMSGRGQELIDLLGQYGVQRLDALPLEQWGNFLTAVRAL